MDPKDTMLLSTKEAFTSDFKDILPIQIDKDNKGISVPNKIKGNNENYIEFTGDIRIPKFHVIEFAREAVKEVNAGKIGYMTFGDQLAIVGATPTDKRNWENDRKVYIWDILSVNNSIYANEMIQCKTLNITSDGRIKHKKQKLDSKTSLEKVRSLIPSQFQFKNGTQPICGFIAQEVQKALPSCVSSQRSFIANIYDSAIRKGNRLTFKQFRTSDLATKDGVLYPNLQLRTKSEDIHVKIVSILDEHSVELDSYTVEEEVIAYGQEVDDFLTIDKNQLFTLTTSALQALDHQQQALDHQQQALDHQQQALEGQVKVLNERIQTLELQLREERESNRTTIHRMLRRLSALETK
jgi:hypothetical protein